jgi:hypothetical protein
MTNGETPQRASGEAVILAPRHMQFLAVGIGTIIVSLFTAERCARPMAPELPFTGGAQRRVCIVSGDQADCSVGERARVPMSLLRIWRFPLRGRLRVNPHPQAFNA